MANAKLEIEKTFNREGGFQNLVNDKANYVNGLLIGTNHGISAQAYSTYYHKIPTVADMQALTPDQAELIFKSLFWDKINGDKILNQSVAALMFQYIIGAGSSQLSDIKDIANTTFGKNVLISSDSPVSDLDSNFINHLDQPKFHANLKAWRFTYYDLIVSRSIAAWELKNKRKITEPEALKETLKQFLQGWKNRLNTHIFTP